MTTCASLITKTYKKAKADSVRPPDPFVNPKCLPICGGQVTFAISLRESYMGCSCCSGSPEMQIDVNCSRCKTPYFDGIERMRDSPTTVVEELLNA